MGDLKKVTSGDPLEISADAWNTVIDAAVDFQNRRHRQAPGRGTSAADDSGVVYIQNNTPASDYDKGQALILYSVAIGPADNLTSFQAGPVMNFTYPIAGDAVARKPFAILLDAMPHGTVARARVSGLIVARINVINPSHKFADLPAAGGVYLDSAPFGRAAIIWKDSASTGLGLQWAILNLEPATAERTGWFVATGDWVNASGNGSYVDTNPCPDSTGAIPDASATVRVYLPRYSAGEDPNVRSGQVIPGTYMADGKVICPANTCGGIIGKTIRMHFDYGAIPGGWAYCTGRTFDAIPARGIYSFWIPDMRGRFPAGVDPGMSRMFEIGVDDPQTIIGGGGGYRGHGKGTWDPGENDHGTHPTHADHPEHEHALYSFPASVASGALSINLPTDRENHDTATYPAMPHDAHNDHGLTDNRPPFMTMAFIMRTD